MKTLYKNCRIYDGTGAEAFNGEILVDGDKIAEVAPHISTPADETVNLGGLSIAPGFIDCHSHNDWFAIKQEPLPYFEPFIRQGICSFVTGNCGLSAAGFEKDTPNLKKIGGGL